MTISKGFAGEFCKELIVYCRPSMTKALDVFAPILLTWFSMQIKYFITFGYKFLCLWIWAFLYINYNRNMSAYMQCEMLMANCITYFHKVLSNRSDPGFTFYQFPSMWNNIYDHVGFCFFKFHVWLYAKVKILIQLELWFS